MHALFILGFSVILDLALALWGGFVFKVLWKWFIVPPFSLPELSWLNAVGVMFIITLIIGHPSIDEKGDFDEATFGLIIKNLIVTLPALFFGWIIHSAM